MKLADEDYLGAFLNLAFQSVLLSDLTLRSQSVRLYSIRLNRKPYFPGAGSAYRLLQHRFLTSSYPSVLCQPAFFMAIYIMEDISHQREGGVIYLYIYYIIVCEVNCSHCATLEGNESVHEVSR